MLSNACLPLLCFNLYGLATTFWRWYSPELGHLTNDFFGISTKIIATHSLPADTLDSSREILFCVTSQTDTAGIGALLFLRATINYQAGGSAAVVYGTMGTKLAMTRHRDWRASTF